MKDIQTMTVQELKSMAAEHNIDLTGCKKKVNIIERLEEEINMEETDNKVVVEETKEGAFYLDDGTECARSAYIRQEFCKNRSRKDIANELDVKYYIVYAATANMYNDIHRESGNNTKGRGSQIVSKVNKNFEFVNDDGEVVETEEEAGKVPRADLMRELIQEGVTRKDLQKHFDVSYATVYAATKDICDELGLSSATKKVITHPETGEEVNRADYIRELYADGTGLTRREIAEYLTKLTGELVDYAAVWNATKPEKAEVATENEVATEEE